MSATVCRERRAPADGVELVGRLRGHNRSRWPGSTLVRMDSRRERNSGGHTGVRAFPRQAFTWTIAVVLRFRDRLRLSWRGFLALVGAVAALGFAGLVLTAVSEDVVVRDGLERHDPANLQFFTDHRSAAVVSVAKVWTQLGGVGVLVVVAIGAGVFLWFGGARLVAAAAPLFALLMAGALAGVGKMLVARSRPPEQFRLIPESDASFPSGHSTDSAALYLTLGLIVAVVLFRRPITRALIVGAAGLIAVGVGVSRLVLGVHWMTDVLAGWALGSTVAVIVSTGALLACHLAPIDPSSGAGGRRRVLAFSHRLLTWRRPTVHRVAA